MNKQSSSIEDIFLNKNFCKTNDVKYVKEFFSLESGEYIYYLKTIKAQGFRLIIHPSFNKISELESIHGVTLHNQKSHHSNYAKFPSTEKQGMHYGMDFHLETLNSIEFFLNVFNGSIPSIHLKYTEPNLLNELDALYSGKPEIIKRIINQIHRPSAIRNAILNFRGRTCQICGFEGFLKKDNTLYAETHHMYELNKLAPLTLQSWNILVLCSNCHKKMHYADVKSEYKDNSWTIFLEEQQYCLG